MVLSLFTTLGYSPQADFDLLVALFQVGHKQVVTDSQTIIKCVQCNC